MSRHAFWTEVWYGLQYHPDWLHKYGETYKLNGRVALQDDLPVAAVLNYLERHPPPADRQVYDDTGWLRWRVVNDYAFSAFLQFARSDPLFVLQAFQYKLLGNIHKLSWAVVEVFGNRSDLDYALLIFLLLGVAITASRFGQPVESDGWKYLVMAFIAAALSVSPSVATLSRWQLMSDGIYLTSFALLLLMTFMVTALIHRLRFSLLPDRLPLWLMRRPITFATAGGAIRSSKILPIFGCIVIAALLSSAALMLVKRVQAPSSWVVSAAEAPTNLADLPLLSDLRFAWFNIAGINAQVVPGVPLVSAVPMLRLIALDDGVHTLAFRVTGLVKNERYRIAAWVRPQAGANFGIAARDQADNDNGPNNSRAVFDLASRNVLMAKGNGTPGIALAGDWLLVWMDLGTTDGQYVVSFYVCNRDAKSYAADGQLAVILGGIAAN